MHIYIYIYIYVIMKAMCPPGYHHDGFMATHALIQLITYYHSVSCVMDHL